MAPSTQRRLQASLDDIFSTNPISTWDYDRDIPKLFGSMTGAVLNEVLRVIPPAVVIPKVTASPQSVVFNGREVVLPADTLIGLNVVATHRNPQFWPSLGPSKRTGKPNDLGDFIPERWIVSSSGTNTPHDSDDEDEDADEIGGPSGRDTSASLYRPVRGSYIPFSEGPRACLGRRFAQVEVLAVLAVIFSQYSIELDVGEFATDEELDNMDDTGRRKVWEKARDRSQWLIDNCCFSIFTLKLRSEHVPVRLVKRGKERFDYSE
jgi:cytochrome P450